MLGCATDGTGDDFGLVAVDATSRQLPGDLKRVEHAGSVARLQPDRYRVFVLRFHRGSARYRLLLAGLLAPLRPVGGHPLRYRFLLRGRHLAALPRRLGLGLALRDRGSRLSRRRRAARPGPRRRRGGSKKLLDSRSTPLDLRLEAVDFTLPVGNRLCDDTHGDGE